ncbi:MAG: hypothetical protein HY023_08860 [Chloroflexi bacterium]|nr:hypothetical protein [Chloroflexota bacterium]
MYASNQLMYPPQVTPVLRDSRGPEWRRLVDKVTELPEDHPENLAFTLTMIRLNGCMECETDSYRAMRGCDSCALQTLRRFKGQDKDLTVRYKQALKDVVAYFGVETAAGQKKAA